MVTISGTGWFKHVTPTERNIARTDQALSTLAPIMVIHKAPPENLRLEAVAPNLLPRVLMLCFLPTGSTLERFLFPKLYLCFLSSKM